MYKGLKLPSCTIVMYIITILAAIFLYCQNSLNFQEMVLSVVNTIFLLNIILEVIKKVYQPVVTEKRKRWILYFCYVLSFSLLIFSQNRDWLPLWFIGPLSLSVYLHPYIGTGFQFLFSFLYCLLFHKSAEYMAFYFILGSVLCLLGENLKNMRFFIYLFLIGLSLDITLLFLMNNWSMAESIPILPSFLTTGAIIGFVSFPVWIQKKNWKKRFFFPEKKKKSFQSEKEIPIKEESYAQETLKEETSFFPQEEISFRNEILLQERLENLLKEDYPLTIKMKQFSEALYHHSLEVSILSGEAIEITGGNKNLAKAGGLFHEIGRMVSNRYVEEGVKIASECFFPEEVIQIIQEHSLKNEKPHSIEAAVVMLADSILTTIQYLEEQHETPVTNKTEIVTNIFDLRFQKGTLDEANLTIEQYKRLKEFFMANI